MSGILASFWGIRIEVRTLEVRRAGGCSEDRQKKTTYPSAKGGDARGRRGAGSFQAPGAVETGGSPL
jgi:hypothetical protein